MYIPAILSSFLAFSILSRIFFNPNCWLLSIFIGSKFAKGFELVLSATTLDKSIFRKCFLSSCFIDLFFWDDIEATPIIIKNITKTDSNMPRTVENIFFKKLSMF